MIKIANTISNKVVIIIFCKNDIFSKFKLKKMMTKLSIKQFNFEIFYFWQFSLLSNFDEFSKILANLGVFFWLNFG